MNVIDLIRNADSVPEILTALSVYAQSLGDIAAMPDWFVRPLQGEADVRERIVALFAVVNLTSQHRLHRDCDAAKRALRVFAAGLQRLAQRRPR